MKETHRVKVAVNGKHIFTTPWKDSAEEALAYVHDLIFVGTVQIHLQLAGQSDSTEWIHPV